VIKRGEIRSQKGGTAGTLHLSNRHRRKSQEMGSQAVWAFRAREEEIRGEHPEGKLRELSWKKPGLTLVFSD